jgi:hypothetical protein
MANTKISALTSATTPLAGTEVLPIVQSSTTVKVATDDLTVKNIRSNATTGILQVTGPAAASTRVMTVPNANFTAARTDAAQSFTGDQTLSTGNLIVGTSGKGVTNASGTVALNFTTTETTIQGLRFGLGPGAVSGNTVFGNAAFNSNTTAGANTVIGFQALFTSNRTADANGENTAVGHQAGYETSTGQKNTYFGRYAGNQQATGSNNVYIGAYSQASASNVTNEIVLAYNLTGKGSNTAYIGGSSGAYNQANSATWSVISDGRIKENVATLTGALESILKLRPVSFNYILTKNPDVSFIAQEYELVFPEQVMQHTASKEEKELINSDTLYGVRQNLVPYLVSAIQELKAEIELLKSQIGSN